MIITDKQLLESLTADPSEGVFNELYARYQLFVLRYLKSYFKDQSFVKDLFQDFWLGVWENPSMLKCDKSGSARLSIISKLKYMILEEYRKTLRNLIVLMAPEDLAKLNNRDWVEMGAHQYIEFKELLRIIDLCFNERQERSKRIFKLRLQNYSVREVAQILGISEQTIYNSYSLSRVQVQKIFARYFPDYTLPLLVPA